MKYSYPTINLKENARRSPCCGSIAALLALLAGSLVFFSGCAHGIAAHTDTISDRESRSIVVEEDSLVAVVVEFPADHGDTLYRPSICGQIPALLSQAYRSAGLGDYNRADSIMLSCHAALTDSCIGYEDIDSPSVLMDQIAVFYSDSMPARYLDYLPEDLGIAVFRRQISESLDSLVVPSADSGKEIYLNCSRGIPYNIPITWNDRVHRALHLVLRRRKSSVEAWLSRAEHYLPMYKKMFADSGLPTDLAYLPLIESAFNPKAYSYAHASGIWQFISETGSRYGLRKNFWVDERRDPVKSTRSAISYLKKLYGDFGDWYLALAAYNRGEGGVARAIKRAGTDNYWDLNLPKQTEDYVPHFLAALMIAKNPECFHYTVTPQSPFDHDIIPIGECIELNKIAKGIGVEQNYLKELNPHILRWCTPPNMDSVQLILPARKADVYKTFYASLTDEDKVNWYRYTIHPGDNLSSIAARFGTTVSAIKSINNLRNSRIIAGKHLLIPITVSETSGAVVQHARVSTASTEQPSPKSGKRLTYRVKKGDTVSEIAKIFDIDTKSVLQWNNLPSARALRAGALLTLYAPDREREGKATKARNAEILSDTAGTIPGTHIVSAGDNLYRIASGFGISTKTLAAWNDLDEKSLLHPGDTLRLRYRPSGKKTNSPEPEKKAQTVDFDNGTTYRVSSGDNLSKIADLFNVELLSLMSHNGLSRKSVLRPGMLLKIPRKMHPKRTETEEISAQVVYYRVGRGDNLWRIARVFDMPLEALLRLNNLETDSVIMPGDTIRVVTSEAM